MVYVDYIKNPHWESTRIKDPTQFSVISQVSINKSGLQSLTVLRVAIPLDWEPGENQQLESKEGKLYRTCYGIILQMTCVV